MSSDRVAVLINFPPLTYLFLFYTLVVHLFSHTEFITYS